MSSDTATIPQVQTAALVRELGGRVDFVSDYPVPIPGDNEVLVKVLYTGVCQSDLHTKAGTAPGPTGDPITAIKLPHVGGHEGVGRIVRFGPAKSSSGNDNEDGRSTDDVKLTSLVGIRFLSRVCKSCDYCLAGDEQYCGKSTNHLHHEDGSFQEYCVLDRGYLTVLPEVEAARREEWEQQLGPVLCAGVTAYKAVFNANCGEGKWLVVVGAGGGLGHFAVQYGLALGSRVLGIDTGSSKQRFVTSLGAHAFLDYATSSSADLISSVHDLTAGGAHAVIVASGNTAAYTQAANMLRIGGTLCCIGIPPGKSYLETPVAGIAIKGLKIVGNLVGSMKETMQAVELCRMGKVTPHVQVREFRELEEVYRMLEKGDVEGRVVLRIGAPPVIV